MKKIFFFLLLIIPFRGASALSLSDIRTEIRLRIKDSDAVRRRYSDTQLNNIINQTQRDVVNVSWIIKKSTAIPLAINTTYYSFPSDIIAIHRVTFRNANLPEATLQSLDSRAEFGAWATQYGLPTDYFQDPAQPGKIGVYPWPQTVSSTGTLSIIYYSQGTDLALDADFPFNGDSRYLPYDDLLIFEPCYKIFLTEGDATKAGEYKAYYEARLQILLAAVGNKPNFLPGFSAQRK